MYRYVMVWMGSGLFTIVTCLAQVRSFLCVHMLFRESGMWVGQMTPNSRGTVTVAIQREIFNIVPLDCA
jgi:hypothetical protein